MNRLIKTLHIVFACLWLGTAASVVVLQCVRGWSADNRALSSLNIELAVLDASLIIPGAVGSLLTGFLICKTTPWHFFRYRWVIVKWVGTLSGILLGTLLLGPWQVRMVNLSGELVGPPITGGPYDLIRLPFTIVGFFQVYLLIAMIAISVVKPWGKRITDRTVAAIARLAGSKDADSIRFVGNEHAQRTISGTGSVKPAD